MKKPRGTEERERHSCPSLTLLDSPLEVSVVVGLQLQRERLDQALPAFLTHRKHDVICYFSIVSRAVISTVFGRVF